MTAAVQDLIAAALHDRPELAESDVDLANRQISGKAARNALLPSLALVGFYGGSGLAGPLNPIYSLPTPNSSNVPIDYSGALANAFNNSSPDYYIGLSLNIPLRNRVAKADQYRSELEYRQAELRREQLEKANSHRSAQRAICFGAIRSAGWRGHESQGSGATDVRNHARRNRCSGRDRPPDHDGPA